MRNVLHQAVQNFRQTTGILQGARQDMESIRLQIEEAICNEGPICRYQATTIVQAYELQARELAKGRRVSIDVKMIPGLMEPGDHPKNLILRVISETP
jgi:hypothetical protein